MKILVCNKFYRPVGGPETIVLDTIRELGALGHTMIPFAMAHPDNVESEYSHYFVPNIDYNKKGGKGITHLVKEAIDIVYSKEARQRIEKLIADTKPDVAHAHNIYHQLSPSILIALKKAGIPVALTLHDGKPLCANMLFLVHGKVCERCGGRRFYNAVIHKCVKDSLPSSLVCCLEEYIHKWTGVYERDVDLFITPSQFLKDKIVEHGRLREDQIEVLYNYADTKSIAPDYTPGDYGLFLGKLEPHKGVRTLLQACKEIPDFEVRLAGRGPLYEEGQRAANEYGLGKVKFVGFQSGPDLANLIRGSRFVVLPAEWYENCPMVILEALSAGKPVIASRIGGIPELVDDQVDGLLFEPGDAAALAESMRKLITNPSLATDMGRNGRAKMEKRFSIELYMDSLVRVYERIA
ncbi:MAG: glycosyltransferase family 4 protein [Armatimonadetes bacterium]|nr:glycosyltransferase family 4 protein [Armatimonadota bacterium]